MTRSEAGKLGSIKARDTVKKLYEARIEEYNKNPKLCKNCSKPLPYEKRNYTFCNSICSAEFNNHKRAGYKQKTIICKNCGKEFIVNQKDKRQYCSCKCDIEYKNKKRFEKITNDGGLKTENRQISKKYLIKKNGNKCEICGITEWLGKPIMLILDHIDGNSNNNKIENWRLICSNCDATLPTYKSKNKKSGRDRSKYNKA
jgi:hypothetical protein